MAADRYAGRRQKLIPQLKSAGAAALLVSDFTNVTYLTGFTGDDSFLLVGRGSAILISDGRYTTQISQECPDLDVYIRTQKETILVAAAKVARKSGISNLAFESACVTVAQFEKLRDELKNIELVGLAGAVEELRLVKDGDEIAAIRSAIYQAEKGFDVLRAGLQGTLTEREVAHDLEHAMRRFGAKGASFPPIVAVGERAALPHARPTDRLISAADFVLVDWGADGPTGYKSDLTRVLATGKISTKLEKVYRVVLKAQLAGIHAVKAGARCCDVDAAARKVIHDAGYGQFFSHGLGHGIGLDIHEGPRLSAASEVRLKAGMVVTIEPGIYLEGWGGVRIEDDVLVTRGGCEVLTSCPKEFEQAVVG